MSSFTTSTHSAGCLVSAESFSRVWLFATPWAVAHQVPLSMGFSRLSAPSLANILANKKVHSKLVLSVTLANKKLLYQQVFPMALDILVRLQAL